MNAAGMANGVVHDDEWVGKHDKLRKRSECNSREKNKSTPGSPRSSSDSCQTRYCHEGQAAGTTGIWFHPPWDTHYSTWGMPALQPIPLHSPSPQLSGGEHICCVGTWGPPLHSWCSSPPCLDWHQPIALLLLGWLHSRNNQLERGKWQAEPQLGLGGRLSCCGICCGCGSCWWCHWRCWGQHILSSCIDWGFPCTSVQGDGIAMPFWWPGLCEEPLKSGSLSVVCWCGPAWLRHTSPQRLKGRATEEGGRTTHHLSQKRRPSSHCWDLISRRCQQIQSHWPGGGKPQWTHLEGILKVGHVWKNGQCHQVVCDGVVCAAWSHV